MSRETSKSFKKEKPEPEKNERGLRYITENFCLKLCEYLGGYEYPQLNSRLYLHFQGFHKIENLNRFINVKVLYLENNLIEKIEPEISKMQKLKKMWICENQIKELENLPDNIENLWIANNLIEKIPDDFDKYKEINFLNIAGNFIIDLKDIYIIEKLTNLNIKSKEDAIKSTEKLPCNSLITGGHLDGINTMNINGEITIKKQELLESNNLHGTGCNLSSAIVAKLIPV